MKKSLFKTKDGVPIYLGDIFYYITAHLTPCYCDTVKDGWEEHLIGYNFSTQNLCQEYINKNFK